MSNGLWPPLDDVIDHAADLAADEWIQANCRHAFDTLGPSQREKYRDALRTHFRSNLVKAYLDGIAALDIEQPLPYPMKALRAVAAA